jgi:hypothetical protein
MFVIRRWGTEVRVEGGLPSEVSNTDTYLHGLVSLVVKSDVLYYCIEGA